MYSSQPHPTATSQGGTHQAEADKTTERMQRQSESSGYTTTSCVVDPKPTARFCATPCFRFTSIGRRPDMIARATCAVRCGKRRYQVPARRGMNRIRRNSPGGDLSCDVPIERQERGRVSRSYGYG